MEVFGGSPGLRGPGLEGRPLGTQPRARVTVASGSGNKLQGSVPLVAMETWGDAKCVDFVFRQLKDDAVALVDVLAPPDFVLDAPIGRADGEVRALPCPVGPPSVSWGPRGAAQLSQGLR